MFEPFSFLPTPLQGGSNRRDGVFDNLHMNFGSAEGRSKCFQICFDCHWSQAGSPFRDKFLNEGRVGEMEDIGFLARLPNVFKNARTTLLYRLMTEGELRAVAYSSQSRRYSSTDGMSVRVPVTRSES